MFDRTQIANSIGKEVGKTANRIWHVTAGFFTAYLLNLLILEENEERPEW
jgi:hypothetical protein